MVGISTVKQSFIYFLCNYLKKINKILIMVMSLATLSITCIYKVKNKISAPFLILTLNRLVNSSNLGNNSLLVYRLCRAFKHFSLTSPCFRNTNKNTKAAVISMIQVLKKTKVCMKNKINFSLTTQLISYCNSIQDETKELHSLC
jgi:hypothetical protein